MAETRIRQSFELGGKVAIVTGASRGIGESIARGFAEFGAQVVITSRKQEDIEQVAETFIRDGYNVLPVACHVGDPNQLNTLVEKTISHFGRIDILVNNAATNPQFGPIEDFSNDLFDKMMAINVKSAFSLSNLCFPEMKKRGGGSIIHISSVEGIIPSPGLGVYSINKAAMIMLAKVQAKEWGMYNVRSNVICPGLVQTKFSSALWNNKSLLEKWNEKVPLRRMAHPDELAGMALFLASDASSYCTGMEFKVDGGYLIS